ncbi:MAG TPA: PAS domain-containing protein [Oxalicibacterium sp.]|nr:PAS domain-containing protein [Oxalicibacterium sp.]
MQPNKTPLGSAEVILESISDAFFFLDDAWRFVYVNHQTTVVLDRPAEDLLGKVIWDVYPHLLGSEFEKVYLRVAAERKSESFTAYYPRNDCWYEVHCYPAAGGISIYFRDATRRMNAEELLRKSEIHFRLMANAIPQIIWITDANGQLEFFNQQWPRFTGATHGLINLKEVITTYLHPDDQGFTLDAWEHSLRTGERFNVEHRIRSDTGEYHWFLALCEPHRDAESGELVRWYGTSTDINAHKLTAQALAEVSAESDRRRRLYEAFFSNSPDFSYVFDLEHRFVYANEMLLKTWGKSRDEAIGKTCLELGYEPWHAAMHDREIEQIKATGVPIRGDVPFEGTSGRRIYNYIFFPVFGPDGQVEAVAGTTRDVTEAAYERERTEALIRLTDAIRGTEDPDEVAFAAARILGETLQASRVGYGIIDPDSETLHVGRDWNASGVQTLAGVYRFRDFGSYIDDLKQGKCVAIDDVALDPRTACAAASLTQHSAAAFVNVPVLEQGRLVAMLFINQMHSRRWSEGEIALAIEMAERTRTASERLRSALALQQSEARLRQINESLEAEVQARTQQLIASEEALRHSQKMEAVGQLTGGLAHDFNNLLGGIMGSLELARMKISSGRVSDIDRYIDIAVGATKRAAALTHRLLAFSRRQTLAPKAIDANRLIGGMADLIRRTLGPSIELEVRGEDDLWAICADPPQLENALLNLCINARDAMPDGGRVTLAAANKKMNGAEAAEYGLAPGEYVSLSVTDTGTGMTPEVVSRAFDPFFTTKPLGEGTGLGLSMVYGFARQSGGQIHVESAVGVGTTMRIYLPRHHGTEESGEADNPEKEESTGSGEVVLVVDDEASIRMLIVEVLTQAGYVAMEAVDGPGALEILQSKARVDLLITDVGLPGGMNGRQIADAARVHRPELKVLFITGYAENSVFGTTYMESGMQVLTKPFTLEALTRKIQEIVDMPVAM